MAMPWFPFTLRSFPLSPVHFICVFVCVYSFWSVRTLSLWLSPSGPGSYNRNNELFSSVAANQTRFTKKKDSGGHGWLSLSVSHKPHTYTHTSLWLPLSYMSPVCRGHHGNIVVCSKWVGCCDGVLTKVYWSTRFGACFKEKSCSSLLRPAIDKLKSLETNLMNLYSWDIYLCVISSLSYVPVDRSECVWLCFCILSVYIYTCYCSMGTSCGYVYAAEMIHDFLCCFKERKFTL